MAKRKKNRPSGARPGGTKTATPSTALPRVAPAEPGGPNRAARKEEARRQREAIQKRMARRKTYRVVAAVVAVLLVGGAITAYQLTRPSPAPAAGCSPVQATKVMTSDARDHAHLTTERPSLSTYPTTPPASGPHKSTPLDAGVYPQPPDIYQAIHSLEHGAVVIWYRPGADPSAVEKITSFYQQTTNSDHVIVAPYNYPPQGKAGVLPAGKDMVLVAWHRYEACADPSIAVARNFVKFYRTPTGVRQPPGYKGVAREPGFAI